MGIPFSWSPRLPRPQMVTRGFRLDPPLMRLWVLSLSFFFFFFVLVGGSSSNDRRAL